MQIIAGTPCIMGATNVTKAVVTENLSFSRLRFGTSPFSIMFSRAKTPQFIHTYSFIFSVHQWPKASRLNGSIRVKNLLASKKFNLKCYPGLSGVISGCRRTVQSKRREASSKAAIRTETVSVLFPTTLTVISRVVLVNINSDSFRSRVGSNRVLTVAELVSNFQGVYVRARGRQVRALCINVA